VRLGVVVVTHGQLATELVNSAEMIVGDLPHFTAVSIGWHEDVDHAREEIGRAINRVGTIAPGEGERPSVLVLADMFGATPCNVAQRLVDGVRSKLVCGVNLPMLLRTVSYRHESLDALISRAIIGATQGVMQVAVTAPQNQARRSTHDQDHRDHQQ